MEMDEFLKSLGINEAGVYEGHKYVVELADSDTYSKAYTILSKSDKVDLDGDWTLVSQKMSELMFLSDDYDVKLIANYTDDIYRIVVEKGEDLQ